MDRYRRARENHRQRPRPRGLLARCWRAVVGVMFYCIVNTSATDEELPEEAVNDIRPPRHDANINTNYPQNYNNNSQHETRHWNSTANQTQDIALPRGRFNTSQESREQHFERIKQPLEQDAKSREAVGKFNELEAKAIPTPRDLYKKPESDDEHNTADVCKNSASTSTTNDADEESTSSNEKVKSQEHVEKLYKPQAKVAPTPRALYKKRQRDKACNTAGKNTANAVSTDDEKTTYAQNPIPPTTKPRKSQKKKRIFKLKKAAKARGSDLSQRSSSKDDSSSSATLSDKEKPASVKKRDVDEHRAVFYEPDGRRKGGEIIPDYYEFLIRVLNTGYKAPSQAGTAAEVEDNKHVTQDSGQVRQVQSHSSKDDCPPYGVMTTSLADVCTCQSPLPDVEVNQPKNWPSYLPKFREIIPIEVELGLRPPRG